MTAYALPPGEVLELRHLMDEEVDSVNGGLIWFGVGVGVGVVVGMLLGTPLYIRW